MLKVTSDIQLALDKGNCVLLCMLDLSAAFDLVVHKILIQRMREELGISGVALNWFSSYLHARTQSVAVGTGVSKPVELETGVPQGLVLDPLLFLIYVLPLKRIFQKHSVSYHSYADDTQVYVSFSPKTQNAVQSAIHKALSTRCLEHGCIRIS